MSSWRWQASRGTIPGGDFYRGPLTFDDAVDAYALAEGWLLEPGVDHVAIFLQSPANLGSWGVADTRDAGDEWVVGLERWQANERRAVAEGRA